MTSYSDIMTSYVCSIAACHESEHGEKVLSLVRARHVCRTSVHTRSPQAHLDPTGKMVLLVKIWSSCIRVHCSEIVGSVLSGIILSEGRYAFVLWAWFFLSPGFLDFKSNILDFWVLKNVGTTCLGVQFSPESIALVPTS